MAHYNSGDPPAVSMDTESETMAGVITKTIIQSPVVRWILHARIRKSACNDVVFVGDDFIHVKQVRGPGTLQHIATKDDFDGRIRAAKVFNNRKEAPDEDLFLKIEDGITDPAIENIPPQCLILTLTTNDLLFLWLAADEDGTPRFIQQACPMPTFDRMLFQPGEYLAVDPQSRAIAVAANEREVVIYSAKSKERIQHELQTREPDWGLVSAEQPIQIQGVIRHMDFLIPPTDDQGAEDEDHIILLLIVMDQRKTRAVWIDWYASSDIHHAQIHAGQPLDVVRTVPSLLVPLRNAAFLLIHGAEIKCWKDILSGSATSTVLDSFSGEPAHPGASARQPIWVNWCRPKRGHGARRDTDHLYLVREDGNMYLIQITPHSMDTSNAGSFQCHVGTAFASLGDSRNPDILAAGGEMSNGSVQSIGSWFTPLDVPELTRRSWAEPEWIETIPNWASVTDMVVSTLPGRSHRSRDGIFVTSCRQPYGAVTELRHGLDASLFAYFEIDGLKSVTDVWALPFVAVGHILVLLSSPAGTRLIDVIPDAGMEMEEVDDVTIGLDSASRTLAASVTTDGKIIQITEGSLCLTPGSSANFEDCARIQCDDGSSILAAAIDTTHSIAVTATRRDKAQDPFTLQCYKLHADDSVASGNAQIAETASCILDGEPLCSAVFVTSSSDVIALVATADGELSAFAIDQKGSLDTISHIGLPYSSDGPGICDSIAILSSDAAVLAVCGLRDGRLYTVAMNQDDPVLFGKREVIPFSETAVKLSQPPNEQTFAYAVSGLDTCLLTLNGNDTNSLCIQSVWMSDRQRPELAQGAVVACTRMPPAHLLASGEIAGSLVMISGDEFLVASLNRTPDTVPRQMPVSGTPSRLMYSEQHRCLVCASSRYGVRYFPSERPHSKPEERRQIWPVIDFLPSRSSAPSYTYELQPGDRVFALLEWCFRSSADKTYSFILVGGSYTRSSGAQRGRILFLQPSNRSWEVVDVKEGRSQTFDASVYALALYDAHRIIACVGHNVVVLQFNTESLKWEDGCPPIKLASPGVQVTVSPTNNSIQVSTLQDGLVSLELTEHGLMDELNNMQLALQSTAPRADDLLSHVAVLASNDHGTTMETGTVLVSTKYGQILGLRPNAAGRQNYTTSDLLFEAQLPRSLTRLRQAAIRPRWKPTPPAGMSGNHILGCSADGSIVGIALLDEELWRRLSWLQRLCEWSELLSPLSWGAPVYSVGEGTYARNERLLPVGLHKGGGGEVAMRTERERVGDGHVDGDVLARLLKVGDPVGVLTRILREVAARDDRAGEWMRKHLEEEIASVEETVAMLKRVMDCWM